MKKLAIGLLTAFPLGAMAAPSCLFDGDLPSDKLAPVKVERIELVRRDMKSLAQLKFKRTRGLVLKTLPERFPFLWDALCETEYLKYVEGEIFKETPISFDFQLLGMIQGISKVQDIRDTMATKSRLLLRLYDVPEKSFSPWVSEPEGDGPTVIPSPHVVKAYVADALVSSNLVLNDESYRKFLVERVSVLDDYELRVKFEPSVRRLLDYYWSVKAEHASGKKVLVGRIAEIRELLKKEVTSIYPWETVLHSLRALASHAKRFEVQTEAKVLVDEIIAAKGVYPMTARIFEGQRKLLLEAQTTALQL